MNVTGATYVFAAFDLARAEVERAEAKLALDREVAAPTVNGRAIEAASRRLTEAADCCRHCRERWAAARQALEVEGS